MSGGMKKHILQLLKGLNEERFFIHLLGPDNLVRELPHKSIRHFPIQLSEKPNPLVKGPQLVQLCQYLRRNRIKLLHCHGVQAAMMGRLAAWPAGTPAVVCTFHNLVYDRPYRPWLKKLYSLGNRFLNGKTDYLITVSMALKQQIMAQEGIPAGKIRVIYNGLERNLLTETTAGDLPPCVAQPLIGMIGRLVPEKGADLFLDAVPLILKEYPETKVWVIGDGPCLTQLRRQSRQLGLEAKVKFWGYVDNPLDLIRSMDVVVVPSRSEGLSIVTLEAMALAKPVVAFNAGALPEVVISGVTGLLVPPFSIQALAEAVVLLLRDDHLRTLMGNSGRLRVQEHFSAEKMIEETETVYELALAASGALLEG